MNFFDQQSKKKRQSFILLCCFIVAFIATGIVIHVVIAGLTTLAGSSNGLFNLSKPAVTLIGLVWSMVFLGALFRTIDVRAGAVSLAKRFGATKVCDFSSNDSEQQLLNTVAEISIAAGTLAPEVYLLRSETSINAFVLGSPSDKNTVQPCVLVVTQGALINFDKDELKAVIAHEYAHITNGDLTVNMHLLVAMGGLMAIDEVGRLLIGKNPGNYFHPGVIAGGLLRLLGSVGVFSGRLIRCAFSRQREYLADACAVQYTRNPYALASALNIIRMQSGVPPLHGIYEQELAHLCFQSGSTRSGFNRLFASHPELQHRIEAIDPNFSVKYRKACEARKNKPVQMANSAVAAGVQLLLSEATNCIAVLLTIFICDDANRQRNYLNAVAFAFNHDYAIRVKNLSTSLSDEIAKNPLALIELAAKTLCISLNTEDRQRLLMKLEGLIRGADDFDLMTYASLQLIRSKLELDFPMIESIGENHCAQGRHVKTFEAMGGEFALLLSLIVESSGATPVSQKKTFERILKCYTRSTYPRRYKKDAGIVTEVTAAFQILYVQPQSVREAFLQHCIEIVEQDGYIARAERILVELFSASLDCPTNLCESLRYR